MGRSYALGLETITQFGSLTRGDATDASDVGLAMRPGEGVSAGGSINSAGWRFLERVGECSCGETLISLGSRQHGRASSRSSQPGICRQPNRRERCLGPQGLSRSGSVWPLVDTRINSLENAKSGGPRGRPLNARPLRVVVGRCDPNYLCSAPLSEWQRRVNRVIAVVGRCGMWSTGPPSTSAIWTPLARAWFPAPPGWTPLARRPRRDTNCWPGGHGRGRHLHPVQPGIGGVVLNITVGRAIRISPPTEGSRDTNHTSPREEVRHYGNWARWQYR
jgi:hypothetical protein